MINADGSNLYSIDLFSLIFCLTSKVNMLAQLGSCCKGIYSSYSAEEIRCIFDDI